MSLRIVFEVLTLVVKTYEDLQEYVRRLARELEEAADMMELTDDEYDDYED